MISQCERYEHYSNKWIELPCLNEKKAAVSLCVLAAKWLYCFGGYIIDSHQDHYLLNRIEMLSLEGDSREQQWIVINSKLLVPACDLGCFPIGSDIILICGGYSKEVDSPYILTQH